MSCGGSLSPGSGRANFVVPSSPFSCECSMKVLMKPSSLGMLQLSKVTSCPHVRGMPSIGKLIYAT